MHVSKVPFSDRVTKRYTHLVGRRGSNPRLLHAIYLSEMFLPAKLRPKKTRLKLLLVKYQD